MQILYVKPYKTFNFSASGKIFEKVAAQIATRGRPAHRAEVALLFLVEEEWQTHGDTDFSRRVEQRWPCYFLWRRAAETRETGRRPARRAEVALLFLVKEGGRNTGDWTSAGA